MARPGGGGGAQSGPWDSHSPRPKAASATPLLSASVLSTAARLAVPVLPPVLGPPPLPSPPRLALQAPQAVRAGQDGGFRDLEL